MFRVETLLHVKSVVGESSHVYVVGKFGEWVPAQLPSLSFDREVMRSGTNSRPSNPLLIHPFKPPKLIFQGMRTTL
ncbi:hypothetical protein TNCV_4427691 [Trichonephila clavipes]|nr:hypothetical protein TNCV_4427691 [Trichonephila clavipes]